jgi:hypothetical protein
LFRWFVRPVPDTYRLRIFDPNGDDAWATGDLGHVGEARIELPAGAVIGRTYGWAVRAHMGESSFGDAYYYSPFTFSRTHHTVATGIIAGPRSPKELLRSAATDPRPRGGATSRDAD